MNTTSIAPPIETSHSRRARRVERSAIVLTCLSVVFALLVLLQMLPTAGGSADTAGLHQVSSTMTLPLFVTGAMISVLFIGVVLLRATQRADD